MTFRKLFGAYVEEYITCMQKTSCPNPLELRRNLYEFFEWMEHRHDSDTPNNWHAIMMEELRDEAA